MVGSGEQLKEMGGVCGSTMSSSGGRGNALTWKSKTRWKKEKEGTKLRRRTRKTVVGQQPLPEGTKALRQGGARGSRRTTNGLSAEGKETQGLALGTSKEEYGGAALSR